MPTVKFNPQSFAIDGRRTWIVGASMHYARSPVESWAELIQAVRQAGFNTIQTACPWMLHEPRRGKFDFEGGSNVRRFIEACGAADLRVVIGLGPFIGQGYAGGGLPGWLNDLPGIALREANEVFLEHAGRYLRRLVTEIADLQVTAGGPILLVQSEHAWNCANPEQAERYLGEIARIMRENGVAVPIINANDLWVESSDTIDTWRGRSNLLRNVRQLRIVQDDAPRVVTGFRPTEEVAWGDRIDTERHPEQVLKGMAEILAAGGQPVVCPFHGGTNFGFLAGRLPGASARWPPPRRPLAPRWERQGRRPTSTAPCVAWLISRATSATSSPIWIPTTSPSRSTRIRRSWAAAEPAVQWCRPFRFEEDRDGSSSSSPTAVRDKPSCCSTMACRCPSILVISWWGGTC